MDGGGEGGSSGGNIVGYVGIEGVGIVGLYCIANSLRVEERGVVEAIFSSKFAATWFNSGVPSAAPLQKRGVVETPGAPPDATTGVSSQRLRRRVRCRPSGMCWRRMPRR